MPHRIFCGFDQPFAVVGQHYVASGGVGDRFELASFVISQFSLVAIAVGDALKPPGAAFELVFDLVGEND